MYSYTPPPFFFQSRGGYHLVTRLSLLTNIAHFLIPDNIIFDFLSKDPSVTPGSVPLILTFYRKRYDSFRDIINFILIFIDGSTTNILNNIKGIFIQANDVF